MPSTDDRPGLARERTGLAWQRSALGFVALAGVMLSVAAHREAPGLLVVGAALVAVAVAVWRRAPRLRGRRRAGPAARSRAHRPRHRPGGAGCRDRGPRPPLRGGLTRQRRVQAAAPPDACCLSGRGADALPRCSHARDDATDPAAALHAPRAPPRWWSASSSASSRSGCSPSAASCCGPTARRTSRATSPRTPSASPVTRPPSPPTASTSTTTAPAGSRATTATATCASRSPRATTSRSSSASRAPRTSPTTCAARRTRR